MGTPAGLQWQQVGIGTAIKRDVFNLLAGNYLTHLSGLGVDLYLGGSHGYLLLHASWPESRVDAPRRVHIDHNILLDELLESILFEGDVGVPRGSVGKIVEALPSRSRCSEQHP